MQMNMEISVWSSENKLSQAYRAPHFEINIIIYRTPLGEYNCFYFLLIQLPPSRAQFFNLIAFKSHITQHRRVESSRVYVLQVLLVFVLLLVLRFVAVASVLLELISRFVAIQMG